jgi:hypothetical protein
MSEPKRLSISSDSDLERTLLRAGRAPATGAARQRALVAATAALATSGLAAGTAAAGGAVVKGGSVASLKWIGVAAFLGVGAATTVAVVGGRRATTTAPTHLVDESVTVTPAAPRGAGRPVPSPIVPVQTQPTAVAPPPAGRPVTAPTPVPPTPQRATRAADPTPSSGSSIPAELATLDQARSAMAGGDPGRALSILDDYAMRFPHASMASEATVMRIEALVKAGNQPAAQRVADSFLRFNPQSPYAARIKSLVGNNP